MADQPISIHYQQMEEWLNDRKSVFGRKSKKEFEALMELTPKLVQLVQYDIPALQKQVKKAGSTVEECHRVSDDADRVKQSTAEKRHAMLQEYGLFRAADSGKSESDEIDTLVERRIDESCEHVAEALRCFAEDSLGAFSSQYEHTVSQLAPGRFHAGVFGAHYPWLQRLYQERHLPLHPPPPCATAEDVAEAASPVIDWGDVEVAVQLNDAQVVEINWDVDAEVPRVEEEEEDALPVADGATFSIDASRAKDRASLLTELRAALCFATERARSKDDSFAHFAESANQLVETLSSSNDALFLRMRSNLRAKEAFLEKMVHFDRAIAAANTRKVNHEMKLAETEEELRVLQPQLQMTVENARATRDACLAQLGLLFPGRRVMIVGDINKYL